MLLQTLFLLVIVLFGVTTTILVAAENESPVERSWLVDEISAPKKMLGHVCDFAELGGQLASDKVNPFHNYQALYCDLFRHYRNSPIRMLEIGFGCGHHVHGSSALLWNKFFRNVKFYGVDYMNDNNAETVQKCVNDFQAANPGLVQKVWLGDQSNVTFLQKIIRESPEKKFDIIVDDGGHESSQILPSLQYLWPMVSYGGYYVVEDVQNRKEFAEKMSHWIHQFSMGGDTARQGPTGDQKFFDAMPKHIKLLGCAFQICYFKKIEPPSHHKLPLIWGANNTIVP